MSEPTTTDDGWRSEWPTEPDTLWWFYGWTSDFAIKNLPISMVVLEVIRTGKTVYYVAYGAFVYPSEGGKGMFKKLEAPQPPKNFP